MDPRTAYFLGVGTGLGGVALVWFVFRLLGPWMAAWATGTPVSLLQVLGMRMRGSDPGLIVATLDTIAKLGETAPPVEEVEAAYLGLPVDQRNISALIRATRPSLMARLEADVRARDTDRRVG
jgi:uncharacterized protein YqfA (UPF0365 family)